MSVTTGKEHSPNPTPTDDLVSHVFGYNITVGPPDITGVEEFSASPTNSVIMGTNKPLLIETQTVDPVHYYSENLKETSGTKTYSFGDITVWKPGTTNNQITFSLNLLGPVPTIFEIDYLTPPLGGTSNLYVNGKHVWPGPNNYYGAKAFIDASFLKSGENELTLKTKELITSITVRSIEVQAEYFWTAFLEGSLGTGGSLSKEVDLTVGNTDTESETNQFSETLGCSGTLEGIGSSLTSALSTSETHSVTISEQATEKKTFTQNCPDGAKSLTFQTWQLCVKFTVGNKTLTIHPPSEVGGKTISRTYEETKPASFN
eukprot:TRINITY_DN3442_c0_g1_i4.p1 TRINITY_DN3442_c0_g1~~TRINITY_DN3442_c0_g1_i4.p1  ORF type:complete len:317 (-),score=26.40 TRINITY_DN3442_c0_g1_i4:413-1363(-)